MASRNDVGRIAEAGAADRADARIEITGLTKRFLTPAGEVFGQLFAAQSEDAGRAGGSCGPGDRDQVRALEGMPEGRRADSSRDIGLATTVVMMLCMPMQ